MTATNEIYNGLKVLTLYHRKGGVGKTFTSSTIAYLLANGGVDGKQKKRRVLLLDFDAQQDSSKAFLPMQGIPGDDEYAPPLHPDFGKIDEDDWGGYNTSTDILFNLPVYEYPTAFENIKILPSEGKIDRVTELTSEPGDLVKMIGRYMTDWFNLPDISSDFDIVIIDNPPSKTSISSGLMLAATHVLIPTEAEYDSVDGAPLLLNRIARLNETRPFPLEIVAILPNKIPHKNRLSLRDKISLSKLYDNNNSTSKYMPDFVIHKRECYRVMERPSCDPSHFDYIHNRYAKDEMNKLHSLVTQKLWGDE